MTFGRSRHLCRISGHATPLVRIAGGARGHGASAIWMRGGLRFGGDGRVIDDSGWDRATDRERFE